MHVTDREDALAPGARDAPLIPVLVHLSDQADALPLGEKGVRIWRLPAWVAEGWGSEGSAGYAARKWRIRSQTQAARPRSRRHRAAWWLITRAQTRLCQFHAMWPWAAYFASLSLGFLTREVRIATLRL